MLNWHIWHKISQYLAYSVLKSLATLGTIWVYTIRHNTTGPGTSTGQCAVANALPNHDQWHAHEPPTAKLDITSSSRYLRTRSPFGQHIGPTWHSWKTHTTHSRPHSIVVQNMRLQPISRKIRYCSILQNSTSPLQLHTDYRRQSRQGSQRIQIPRGHIRQKPHIQQAHYRSEK